MRPGTRSTWQPGHHQPPHPRPSTRRTQDKYRRGVEGGSPPPWASEQSQKQEARSRRPGTRSTWQPGHHQPPHPRPSTRRTQDTYRRGVEGGSSPLGIRAKPEAGGPKLEARNAFNVATGPPPTSPPPAEHAKNAGHVPAGGRRGVAPPGHQRRTQKAERPETWQQPTQAPSHPRPSTRRTQDTYRRGVEGGSSPLGITGGSKGVVPPGHQSKARSRRPEAGGPERVQRGNRATTNLHTPGQARDHPLRVPAGGRRGVVPPGHHRGVEGGSSPLGIRAKPEAGGPKPETRNAFNVATGPPPTSTPPAKHAKNAGQVPAGGRRGVAPPWE
jgi:hypothetical protein